MYKINYLSHNWRTFSNHNTTVKKNLNILHGIVYDFGCGTKPYQKEIESVAEKYIGIDWSNTPHYLTADIVADLNEVLPVESNVADCIVSFQVLEHIYNHKTFINEAYRLLKNDGILFITIPWQWRIHEAPYDYFRYTPYGIKRLLEDAGFSIESIESDSGFFTMLTMKINYFSTRFIRGPKVFKILTKAIFLPFWYLSQIISPIIDRLDKHPEYETSGYIVIARKK